eukprot:2025721-Heterocapsa_arctica.AAC.1
MDGGESEAIASRAADAARSWGQPERVAGSGRREGPVRMASGEKAPAPTQARRAPQRAPWREQGELN